MTWVLIAASALTGWLLAVSFVLALCRAAAQADEFGNPRVAHEGNVVDMATTRRRRSKAGAAKPASVPRRAA